MISNGTGPPPLPRTLPKWAWGLSLLLFPPGLFLAYGYVRLLPWWRAILFAALSTFCLFAIDHLAEGALGQMEAAMLAQLQEGTPMNQSVKLNVCVGLSAAVLVFWAWGILLYRIGNAAHYFPPPVVRAWKSANWTAVLIFAMSLVAIALTAAVGKVQEGF